MPVNDTTRGVELLKVFVALAPGEMVWFRVAPAPADHFSIRLGRYILFCIYLLFAMFSSVVARFFCRAAPVKRSDIRRQKFPFYGAVAWV